MRSHRWFTLLVLASVLLIFILPSVNLCPTALRAMRDAAVIFCVLICAATSCRNLLCATATNLLPVTELQGSLLLKPLERSCVSRC
jgi:hypothetical protein